jgi:hypothetical protein
MSGPKGIFYGYIAQPTAAKGTLPPAGEFAFYIDSTTNHLSMIDSSANVTDLTDDSFAADFSWAEGVDVSVGTTTGSKIGTATSQKLGFFNATPVVQPTALTTAETTITNAGTASDYAIQALTNSSPFGFANQAEGETLVEVVLNNQARIGEIETKLQALGLLA